MMHRIGERDAAQKKKKRYPNLGRATNNGALDVRVHEMKLGSFFSLDASRLPAAGENARSVCEHANKKNQFWTDGCGFDFTFFWSFQ